MDSVQKTLLQIILKLFYACEQTDRQTAERNDYNRRSERS
jgi:hypothetical protein